MHEMNGYFFRQKLIVFYLKAFENKKVTIFEFRNNELQTLNWVNGRAVERAVSETYGCNRSVWTSFSEESI
jgi:hypothetical protein